jgi:hypothetical protein
MEAPFWKLDVSVVGQMHAGKLPAVVMVIKTNKFTKLYENIL